MLETKPSRNLVAGQGPNHTFHQRRQQLYVANKAQLLGLARPAEPTPTSTSTEHSVERKDCMRLWLCSAQGAVRTVWRFPARLSPRPSVARRLLRSPPLATAPECPPLRRRNSCRSATVPGPQCFPPARGRRWTRTALRRLSGSSAPPLGCPQTSLLVRSRQRRNSNYQHRVK